MHVKAVCIDFDDTINDYPEWKEEGYAVIRGKPLPGAKEAIKELRDRGWLVFVHSTRCGYTGGMAAIVNYLNEYNIRVDGVSSNKPPADVYVDDKAVQYKGDWKKTLKEVRGFKHWKRIHKS